MQVRTDSWHYKLSTLFRSDETWVPKDLCSYFWLTVFSTTGAAVIFAALVGLALAVGITIWVLYIKAAWLENTFWTLVGHAAAVGLGLLVLAVMAIDSKYDIAWQVGRFTDWFGRHTVKGTLLFFPFTVPMWAGIGVLFALITPALGIEWVWKRDASARIRHRIGWVFKVGGTFIWNFVPKSPFRAIRNWFKSSREKRATRPPKPKRESLTLSFIGAKKRRICPFIETVSPEGEQVGFAGKRTA